MTIDLERFRKRFAPRWLIFLIDLGIVLLSLGLAYSLRFDFDIPSLELDLLRTSALLFFTIRVLSFILMKTYAGIIRFTGTQDAVRIFQTMLVGSVLLWGIGLLRNVVFDQVYFLPTSIIILEFFLSTFIMIAYRLLVKLMYIEQSNPRKHKRLIIIFGAGESGLITKRTLDRDAGSALEVKFFVDDNRKKSGKKLEGISIRHTDELEKLLGAHKIEQVIFSIMDPDPANRQRIIDICLKHGVQILDVPPVKRWINGQLSFRQLRPIPVEDLLGRDVIELNKEAISLSIKGKRIAVTGAAGSIGSEIVRQLIPYSPQALCLIDQAESSLHAIGLEVESMTRNSIPNNLVLADVCNKKDIEKQLKDFSPDILFHAAAYKHVPLVEANALEGIRTNILGTRNLMEIAQDLKIERFILISTDKAVNPTNVMGASKRAAEILIQAQTPSPDTTFVTTRFGNVLGSSGSVIPLFKQQIEEGGPITVTHQDVERYFMTIPEASQLVLEAAAMGKGKEIFVFDMGQPVKIIELAENMVRLSGLKPGKDIEIKVTGLRPGEKIREEVLASMEDNLPTHNNRILIAKTREVDKSLIESAVSELIECSEPMEAVRKLKRIVPEFKSNNSVYEKLDL